MCNQYENNSNAILLGPQKTVLRNVVKFSEFPYNRQAQILTITVSSIYIGEPLNIGYIHTQLRFESFAITQCSKQQITLDYIIDKLRNLSRTGCECSECRHNEKESQQHLVVQQILVPRFTAMCH